MLRWPCVPHCSPEIYANHFTHHFQVQVAKMLDIYRAANEVLIHPGGVLLPQSAVHFVEHVAPRYSQRGLSSSEFERELLAVDKLSWAAFKQARSLPWFSRTWVAQEMSVNKNTSIVLGRERVTWDKFLAASLIVEEAFFSAVPLDFMAMHSLPMFATIRRRLQDKGPYEAVDLLRILEGTRFLGSSDPRDKIYAFLGLFDNESIKKWLPYPDYDAGVVDVYTAFAAVLGLQGGATLGLLQSSGTSQTSQNYLSSLPSWVPDWSFGNALQRSLRACRAFEHGENGFRCGTRFQSSAGPRSFKLQLNSKHGQDAAGRAIPLGDFVDRTQTRESGLSMRDQILLPLINHLVAGNSSSGYGDNSSVVVKTALFDQVIGLTKLRLFEEQLQAIRPLHPLQLPREALLEIYEEARASLNLSDDEGGEKEHQLARTLIADSWRQKDSCGVTKVHRQWVELLRSAANGSPTPNLDNSDLVLSYAGRVRQTLQDRMFGITKDGRIGIFPATTEHGDQVGIVAGLDLPCVLSKRGEDFALVGEAYIDGVMFGEFEESEEVEFKEIKIV